MTVKDCYEVMKGDYDDVISRFKTDDKVRKALLKVLDDTSFTALCNSIEKNDMDGAARAAQALKSISKNMSLTNLAYSSSILADALKGRQSYGDDVEPLFKKVKKDFALTMSCIQML